MKDTFQLSGPLRIVIVECLNGLRSGLDDLEWNSIFESEPIRFEDSLTTPLWKYQEPEERENREVERC